jgi:hypothetical protein
MTYQTPTDVTLVTTANGEAETRSYVDWPAIFAGIVVATAISLILLAFGSAVGLSFVNFNAGPDVSPLWIAIAAASWLIWVVVSSLMAGGYLTGRLRRRAHDASEHEVDVRDGAHGLIVWGGAMVIGAVLAFSGVSAVITGVGSAVSNVAGTAATAAAEAVDPNAYFLDTLFRRAAAAPADAAAAPAPAPATTDATATTPATPAATTPAAAATTSAPVTSANADADRAEAGRIFAQAALAGELAPEDRTYLAQVVSETTGLPQADAEARVDQTMTAIQTAKDEAAKAAETARKTAVIAAFITAAAAFIAAVGAYWAASMGGRHRDDGTVFETVFRRY